MWPRPASASASCAATGCSRDGLNPPASAPVLPIMASTLEAEALGQFVAKRYGYGPASTCRLFRTGINHTYLLADAGQRAVLRVYSYNWRSRAEIEAELTLLTHLHAQGLGGPTRWRTSRARWCRSWPPRKAHVTRCSSPLPRAISFAF